MNLHVKMLVVLIIFGTVSQFLHADSRKKFLDFQQGSKMDYSSQRNLYENGEQYLEVEYIFGGAKISNKEEQGSIYNFIHIKDFGKLVEVGLPALPAHTDIIALPGDEKPDIEIVDYETKTFSNFNIYPALEPARDTEGAPAPSFQRDDKLYATDAFYPENPVEIINIQTLRDVPLAFVQIRPVLYNPVTKEIKVYTKIKYRVIFRGAGDVMSKAAQGYSKSFSNVLKKSVLNKQIIPEATLHSDSKDGSKNYIIITHDHYLSQAEELATWKRQLGYSVEVVSQSSWTAAQVKDAVHSRYDSWSTKPDYFVIIGDHDGSYAVPGEIHQEPDGDDFATDLYYACMGGASDYVPDMAHGRISVSSSSEASVVIDKIINYEKNPPIDQDFYQNVLNCAQYQDAPTDPPVYDGYAARRFCHTSEEIRDYLQDEQSYSSERVYYTETTWDKAELHYNNGGFSDGQLLPAELRSNSFNWNGGAAEITTAINNGKFMVFHRDHGYVGGSGWAHPYFTTNSMTSLSNGENLPVIFSMNCHTGEFQLDNCFAEKFLRMENKGAVGVVGAAYYSYSGYNDALSIGMIDAIWSNPGLIPDFGTYDTNNNYHIGAGNNIYTMGDVVNQGLFAMVQNIGDNQYTFELFHYFGDPAMKMWTANPNDNQITASHNNTMSVGNNSFTISASNCADGVATLVYDGQLIGKTTLTAGAGVINFNPLNDAAAYATLTISKHNSKPYTVNITITNPLAELSVSQESFTETMDVGVSIEKQLTLANTGADGSVLNYHVLAEDAAKTSADIRNALVLSLKNKLADKKVLSLEELTELRIYEQEHQFINSSRGEVSLNCYPGNVNYASGTTTTSAKTEVSSVNVSDGNAGWITFDVSEIPDGSAINSIDFNFYVNDTNYPYWNVTPIDSDPLSAAASVLYDDITAELISGYYNKQSEASDYSSGWKTLVLGGGANNDLFNNLASDCYGIGMLSRDTNSSYDINIDGWNQENRPYLTVHYTPNLPVLELTFPNDGQMLAIGTTHTISWNHSGASLADVKIELSVNNGTDWTVIAASTSNDGIYDWTVPNTISDQCLIRISDPADVNNSDISNALFKIYKGVSWLLLDKNSGQLSVNESDDITLTFDSSELVNGTYQANITVSSNDEDQPLVSIPVSLLVGFDQHITVETLSFAEKNSDGIWMPQDQEIEESESLNFSITASDPDCTELTYSWKVDGIEVESESEFVYQTTYQSAGTHTIELSVSDGLDGKLKQTSLAKRGPKSNMSFSWNVIVSNKNRAPVIESYSPESLLLNLAYAQVISFALTASDPDEDELIYKWVIDESVQDCLDASFSTDFQVGNHELIGIVSDLELADSTKWVVVGSSGINETLVPQKTVLEGNYPNPFNPSTSIKFGLSEDSHVHVAIYNVQGQLVRDLVQNDLAAGYHIVNFNASGLMSGNYFIVMKANNKVFRSKILMLK